MPKPHITISDDDDAKSVPAPRANAGSCSGRRRSEHDLAKENVFPRKKVPMRTLSLTSGTTI